MDSFVAHVLEQMAAFGPVQARRMFGGHGLYRDGLMFALIVDEQLYFKADAAMAADCERQGLRSFSYVARGRTVKVGYFAAPPDVFEAPECMREWAARAHACAQRARVR